MKNLRTRENKKKLSKSIIETFKEILSHKKFTQCTENKTKYYSHLFVFYGFISLFVVTFFAIISIILSQYPLNFWNPIKILGNIASVFLFIGIGLMIFKRIFNKEKAGKSNYYDWIFLIFLFLLTLSGVGVEAGRFLNWNFAYHIYFFHLVCVWMIILYVPYTKFAHILYRTVAIVYSKHINRN